MKTLKHIAYIVSSILIVQLLATFIEWHWISLGDEGTGYRIGYLFSSLVFWMIIVACCEPINGKEYQN